MLFTIDHINNNPHVLPGVSLGADILDTCSRDTYALEQALEYVRGSMSSFDDTEYHCSDGSKPVAENAPVAVAGVIGGAYSTVSIQVANLLRLFKIPQISYASTSAALSDKTRFDMFARTVPPDSFQAKAMADIVEHFNWTYVSTVASEGDYGEKGIYSFQLEATARNICIAISKKVPQEATAKDFEEIILALKKKPTARAVILFLRVEDAKSLLNAAKTADPSHSLIWVASDGWGTQEMPVRDNIASALGAITIELQSIPVPSFDSYFTSLDPFTNKRNPWFKEYWESVHSCQFDPNVSLKSDNQRHSVVNETIKICTGSEKLTPKNYSQESKIRFVFDAVYALAHALHNMFMDECQHIVARKRLNLRKFAKCVKNIKIDGARLYRDYLLNVSFAGKSIFYTRFCPYRYHG
jgi:metabotropic glutamate receptor 2/3